MRPPTAGGRGVPGAPSERGLSYPPRSSSRTLTSSRVLTPGAAERALLVAFVSFHASLSFQREGLSLQTTTKPNILKEKVLCLGSQNFYNQSYDARNEAQLGN